MGPEEARSVLRTDRHALGSIASNYTHWHLKVGCYPAVFVHGASAFDGRSTVIIERPKPDDK